MTTPDLLSEPLVPSPQSLPTVASIARGMLLQRLGGLKEGEVILEDFDTRRFGRVSEDFPFSVVLTVIHPDFYADVVLGGSVGAGEGYMAGRWRCSDLTALTRILLRNRQVLDGLDGGLSLIATPLRKLLHNLHRNTRRGSRRNIAAHYDLGNEFFQLFLDETLMYSCALFESPEQSLADASIAKIDRICRKLALGPEDHVMEIGTGWGGFALHAARHYGCRITTTTISENQYALAWQRVAEAGLTDRVTILLKDYRDLQGQYDKLVSIEMIEAVGHQYFGTFFRQCASLLKPGGQMLLQAITIADQQYASARDEVDFIKRYIFPGCCIPSITALCDAMTRSSDLRVFHLEDIGPHYATTLESWRRNLLARTDEALALGYSEEFLRLWEFYFSYCSGGFAERALGDTQMLLIKPCCHREPLTPAII